MLETNQAVLEHIARQHAPAWLLLADLYEEQQDPRWLAEAAGAVQHYLEERPADIPAWTRLSLMCRRQDDFRAEGQALVSRSTQPGVSYDLTSEAANRLNRKHDGHWSRWTEVEDDRTILCGTVPDSLDGAPKGELAATDLSRMAWLAVRVNDDARAALHRCRG